MLNNANRSGHASGVRDNQPQASDVRSGNTDGKPDHTVIKVKSSTKIAVKNGRLEVVANS